jgi:hypothetical protein
VYKGLPSGVSDTVVSFSFRLSGGRKHAVEVKKPEAAEIAPDWLKPYCKQLLSNLADQGCTSATLRTHERVAADFAVLCSNCHRMIHRFADAGDLAAFRAFITANVANN